MNKIIFAGHYCINEELVELGSNGFSEYESWKEGVRKFSEDDENSKLILWVNDIGIEKEKRKKLKESYKIPENYAYFLKNSGYSIDNVEVAFESSVRNKSSTFIKKNKKKDIIDVVNSSESNLIRCVENKICELEASIPQKSYVILGPNNEKLVVKDGPNPKCNLILATLFDTYSTEVDTKIFNIFNGIYKNRITLGIHVYKSLYSGDSVFENTYFDFIGNKAVEYA